MTEFNTFFFFLNSISDHLKRIRFKTQRLFGGSSKHAHRQSIETSIIEEAHIVFTTLNSSGHPSLDTSSFSVTVVDEVSI